MKQNVKVTFKQEEVSVILDGKYIGDNPKSIKIDFDLAKDLVFFKRGYYTYRIEIEPNTIFDEMTVDLIKKPKSAELTNKTLLQPDTLLVSSIVTNMNETDLWEIINQNFIENNYYIGSSTSLFPEAKNDIYDSRFKLAIEIVDSKQYRHVYKSPKYLMAYIKIRWALLDKITNEVVFYEETEGIFFVRLNRTKGIIISDKMKIVMENAIEEAQFKLLTNNDFIKLVQEK
ncbi:MAG: hypothetical protein C0596_16240 [Marinilabiliales bacterium]|nr:MAG: hypothetical protein C0596_16240 [Marinilabiliales bacterium]